ncbi:transport permease protein [Alphaproteobacteria bacterium]|nr:transport permease protein [Alphaproteobacteria bacterium]
MTINYFGCVTLLKKEILRFLKVYHQTLFSPVVNIVLFLAVFNLSVGNHIESIQGVDFAVFMSAGLIMMSALQNSFANSSSSFVMGKVMGHIVDYLIPPLGALELLIAFAIGAIARGVCVAIVSYLVILIFVPLKIFSFSYMLIYLLLGCSFLGMMGILCGICSETFDHMSAMTSYVITPLTFLSGTFYSTNSLPPIWREISHYNPIFYMIDGFRYSITGYNDGGIGIGISYLIILNLILGFALFTMLKHGYKIKN